MWIQIKLNPIASLVPKAANPNSIPVCSQRTYLRTNNKKDAWLPLNHKTVVCCFISHKKLSDEELFWVSNYAHFLYLLLFYDDLFDRIVNIAVFWLSTMNTLKTRTQNIPFSVPCLCVRLDTKLFVYISFVSWQSTMFRDSQASAHETNI